MELASLRPRGQAEQCPPRVGSENGSLTGLEALAQLMVRGHVLWACGQAAAMLAHHSSALSSVCHSAGFSPFGESGRTPLRQVQSPEHMAGRQTNVCLLCPQYKADTLKSVQTEQDLREEHPWVDYTPPSLITLLFTDLGVLTPSAVSDELIKLYL